jgi:hypothetical protein
MSFNHGVGCYYKSAISATDYSSVIAWANYGIFTLDELSNGATKRLALA